MRISISPIKDMLEASLLKGDIASAITLSRPWLNRAKREEVIELLSTFPAEDREKIVVLFRDMLSRYPFSLIGCPVLFFAEPEEDQANTNLVLPLAGPDLVEPIEDLLFLGWISKDTLVPMNTPFRPELSLTPVPLSKVHCAVALFRAQHEEIDVNKIELPPQWWAELLSPLEGYLRISARLFAPLPDALDAANIMAASALEEELPSQIYFLEEPLKDWASCAGSTFLNDCRKHFLSANSKNLPF